MLKPEFPGMQHLARIIFRQFRRIDFVAEHWVTEMMEVDANLMGASGMQLALDQTHFIRGANDTILGFRRAPA